MKERLSLSNLNNKRVLVCAAALLLAATGLVALIYFSDSPEDNMVKEGIEKGSIVTKKPSPTVKKKENLLTITPQVSSETVSEAEYNENDQLVESPTQEVPTSAPEPTQPKPTDVPTTEKDQPTSQQQPTDNHEPTESPSPTATPEPTQESLPTPTVAPTQTFTEVPEPTPTNEPLPTPVPTTVPPPPEQTEYEVEESYSPFPISDKFLIAETPGIPSQYDRFIIVHTCPTSLEDSDITINCGVTGPYTGATITFLSPSGMGGGTCEVLRVDAKYPDLEEYELLDFQNGNLVVREKLGIEEYVVKYDDLHCSKLALENYQYGIDYMDIDVSRNNGLLLDRYDRIYLFDEDEECEIKEVWSN